MSRIALVTGTSSGIGLSTAVQLAQAGFTVVATMRNLDKAGPLEERATAAGVSIELRRLDVQDENSIRQCVGGVLAEHGGIDVLVNNAGAGRLGNVEMLSDEEVRQTLDTNFMGVWRVTRAVLPAMRAARAGRVISVTSVGGLMGQVFNDAYCAAKFAVEGFMESLAPVVRRLGIQVSLIEPGPVNTEFIASVQAAVGERPQVSIPDYAPLLEGYLGAVSQAFKAVGQTPDEVAKVIVEAATTEQPHFRYVTSDMMRGVVARKYVDPTGDSAIALAGARLP